jgi:parallel beta-helix repeat protein
MNLNGAQNLLIDGNTFDGNEGAGLSITGDTSGTLVYDNDFTDNRIAIRMVDATNAVIGGTEVGEDNRIVGGGDPMMGDFRDGVVAAGLLTGSTVQNLSITTTVTGVLLQAAQGLALTDITMSKVQWYGLNATGDLSGTTFKNSSIDKTGFGTAVGFGVMLASAQGLVFEDNSISDSVQAGMLASGDCTGTSVINTTWSNTTNLIDNSGGTLTVTPPAP